LREHAAGHAEQAEDIGAKHRFDLLVAGLFHPAENAKASVIHEDIDATEPRDARFDRLGNCRVVVDVEIDRQDSVSRANSTRGSSLRSFKFVGARAEFSLCNTGRRGREAGRRTRVVKIFEKIDSFTFR
jgi:hypothetical protein